MDTDSDRVETAVAMKEGSPSSITPEINEEVIWQMNMKERESGPYPEHPGEAGCGYYIRRLDFNAGSFHLNFPPICEYQGYSDTILKLGLCYICATVERFFAVGSVLARIVVSLDEQPSTRLLKHIIRCYLRLLGNPRACEAL